MTRTPTEQAVARRSTARPVLERPAAVAARTRRVVAVHSVDVAHLALLRVEHSLQGFGDVRSDNPVVLEVVAEGVTAVEDVFDVMAVADDGGDA